MTRILAVVPLPFDATSYYRSYGVFPNLSKQMGDSLRIDAYNPRATQYTWAELIQYDILFLQRPANPANIKLIKYCKDLGIKVWIDHDDNLFELPPYNRVVDEYTPEVKKTMIEMVKMADVLTVSTQALKEFFSRVGVDAQVVPNALNEQFTPMAKELNAVSIVDQYVWRGSETHQGDLYFHTEPLINAIDNRKNTVWHFVGYNPWFATLFLNKLEIWKYHKPDDIFLYFQKLNSLKGQVMHVPLFDEPLNRCKSNIAWIEATAAGMVTIGPNWPEWQKPGIVNYDSIDDYGQKLLQDITNAQELWRASRDYILENLTLQMVNQKRIDIIEKLTAKNKKVEFNTLPQTMIE